MDFFRNEYNTDSELYTEAVLEKIFWGMCNDYRYHYVHSISYMTKPKDNMKYYISPRDRMFANLIFNLLDSMNIIEEYYGVIKIPPVIDDDYYFQNTSDSCLKIILNGNYTIADSTKGELYEIIDNNIIRFNYKNKRIDFVKFIDDVFSGRKQIFNYDKCKNISCTKGFTKNDIHPDSWYIAKSIYYNPQECVVMIFRYKRYGTIIKFPKVDNLGAFVKGEPSNVLLGLALTVSYYIPNIKYIL